MNKIVINTTPAMDKLIGRLMEDMGIPKRLPGYSYIKTAVELCLQDPTVTESITKMLYPDVAMVHHTTSSKIERSMRNAIEVCWELGNTAVFMRMFGYSREDGMFRPTNTRFMNGMAEYLVFLKKIGAAQDDYYPAA